jgi:superfamily II DNA/RNA helicase
VTLLPEQKRLIARMEKDYIAWLEDTANGDVRAAVASLPIVARTRLRQMTLAVPSFLPGSDGLPEIDYAPDAASPKYEALLDIVARVAEPVVAATSSQKYARYVTNRLQRDGLRAFEWSGAVSQRVRDEALEEFRRGGYDVVVGVTEAIGTGIDGLQDASGVLVSLERSDDLTANIQLEGRLDRRGQAREGGVLHYEIVAEDSMDEGIISRQLERRLDINRSLRRRIAA